MDTLCCLLSIVIHLDQLTPVFRQVSSWQSTSDFDEDFASAQTLVAKIYQMLKDNKSFQSACKKQDLIFNYVLQLDRTANDCQPSTLI